MAKRLVFFIALLIILFSVSGCPSGASKPAESADTEPKMDIYSDLEQNEVDANDLKPQWATHFHDKCAWVFKSFVNDEGKVDYERLREESIKVRVLLQEFDNLDPNEYRSWPREDKIAFWINTYNLHKLRVVSANYPIRSSSRFLRVLWGPTDLRHIEDKITLYKFLVMDEEFTFKRIENLFFRGEFENPRVLLAISDACISSPPLRNEPYYGYKLNEQLDDQARRFLSDPRAFKVERQRNRVYLSAIFEAGRYGSEFLKKYAIDRKFKDHPPVTRAVLNFITGYISKRDVSFLEKGSYSVKFMRYDWQINDGY
jgi:hypothetical protein